MSMRIRKEIQAVLWKDHTSLKVRSNIFNLAKNAETSVDQIERFYARNLPLSKEMAINLQSFGSES